MKRAILIAVVLATACGDRSTAPTPVPTKPAPVASISIDLPSLSLEVGQARQLEASVRDANGATLTGRAVQWQSSAPTVATVTVGSSSIYANVAAVSLGTTSIAATSEGKSVTMTVSVIPPAAEDFAIVDAQWTQGAQQADGAIPMVLNGNGALLNVLMSSTAARRAPGTVLLTISDANGVVVRTDSTSPVPFTGTATYEAPTAQFLVPPSALRAGLRWRVQRDPRGTVVDRDASNDVFPRAAPASLATVSLPPMRVRFVPVALSSHGGVSGNVNTANLDGYLQTLRRIMPLGQLITSVRAPLVSSASFGTPPRGGAETFWLQVLQDVDLARVTDTASSDTYWVGVIAPPPGFTFTTFGGYSYVPSNSGATGAGTRSSTVVQTGWFTNTGQSTDLVAHELAHTLGRRHAPCGGAAAIDPQYPEPSGTIGTVGFDVYAWTSGQATNAPVRAASIGDLMGYCFPVWASPYTYLGLLQARQSSAPAALTSAPVPAMRQQVLIVRAQIVAGALTMLPALTLLGTPSSDDSGQYRVDLLDSTGRVLRTQRTRTAAVDHSEAHTLFVALPLSTDDEQRAQAIRVSGPAGDIIRRRAARASAIAVADVGPRRVRAAAATLDVGPRGRHEAVCASPAMSIVVQDHSGGALVATAQADRVELPDALPPAIDISCSDGVRSQRAVAVTTGQRRSPFSP